MTEPQDTATAEETAAAAQDMSASGPAAREPTDDEVAVLLDDVDVPAISAARHTTRVVLRLRNKPGSAPR